ncbi:Prefoldin subunit 4 [Amanita rubescens]|nr:Prefoldin subunit 4 [Amanita rubescens]
MNNLRMLEHEDENNDGAEVTWEDQQRINSFSKLNTRLRSLEGKLEELKQEKEALDDLATELELADEDESVLYKIGETFLQMPLSRAQERLERDQQEIGSRLASIVESAEYCETQMKELKVALYGKFGKAINLDE